MLPREVLAIYDTKEERKKIHRCVEMVCNYYGVKVEYHYSSDPYPKKLDKYLGVMVWSINSEMGNPKKFWKWMEHVQKQKVKVLIFGKLPALIDRKSKALVEYKWFASFLEQVGIQRGKSILKNPLVLKLIRNDHYKILDYERQFTFKGKSFAELKNTNPKNNVHLSVQHKYQKNKKSDLIITGSFGMIALDPAVVEENPENYRLQWVLNPFRLLKKVLKLEGRPIPDISTLNGRRMIYCHIDGDAFTGICRYDKKRTCGIVVYEDILKKYLFPHTLSLVHCWFDPDTKYVELKSVVNQTILKGIKIPIIKKDQERWIKEAQVVFREPWVETAMHGYGHPLKWQRRILALSANSRSFSFDEEFNLSLKVFSTQILKGHLPKIFLWTGDCFPDEEALRRLDELGIINMNGGDTLLDKSHDSLTNVAPIYRKVKQYIQVYASASNENIYTNEWSGPFYGFRNVIQTFERTESPRRICPVNIYYHWYSGELKAAMNALDEVYAWAASKELVPIFGGRHIKNVHGFIQCELYPVKNGWKVLNAGELKTIRFDDSTRIPVVGKQHNVMGYNYEGKRLYVHLGPKDESLIEWKVDSEKQVNLEWATCVVNNYDVKPHGLFLDIWGWRPAKICFDHLPYKLISTKEVRVEHEGTKTILHCNPKGLLKIQLVW